MNLTSIDPMAFELLSELRSERKKNAELQQKLDEAQVWSDSQALEVDRLTKLVDKMVVVAAKERKSETAGALKAHHQGTPTSIDFDDAWRDLRQEARSLREENDDLRRQLDGANVSIDNHAAEMVRLATLTDEYRQHNDRLTNRVNDLERQIDEVEEQAVDDALGPITDEELEAAAGPNVRLPVPNSIEVKTGTPRPEGLKLGAKVLRDYAADELSHKWVDGHSYDDATVISLDDARGEMLIANLVTPVISPYAFKYSDWPTND